MNEELTNNLYNKFPQLFRGRTRPVTESAMSRGFECDDGWYDLIYQLCEDIEKQSANDKTSIPEVTQVKEKFGGLRFYVSESSPSIEQLITDAEDKSLTTCEICGNMAEQVTSRRWVRTLCDVHKQSICT